MGVVKGAISIKDNMTVVLRSIRQEQSAFRQDVEKTKKELQATWDKSAPPSWRPPLPPRRWTP